MSKPAHSIAEWREIFRQQQASGLPVTAFCRQQRVPQASFFAWRRKLREAGSFAEVKLSPEPAFRARGVHPGEHHPGGGEHDPSGIELRLAGQRSVVVRPGFDRQTLLDLVAALESEVHMREGPV